MFLQPPVAKSAGTAAPAEQAAGLVVELSLLFILRTHCQLRANLHAQHAALTSLQCRGEWHSYISDMLLVRT